MYDPTSPEANAERTALLAEMELELELAEIEAELADAFAYEVLEPDQWELWLAGDDSVLVA